MPDGGSGGIDGRKRRPWLAVERQGFLTHPKKQKKSLTRLGFGYILAINRWLRVKP